MNAPKVGFISFLVCVACVACNVVEPEVGPQQDAAPTCSAATTVAASPYGGAPATTEAGACVTRDPRCAADAGYEQDDCDTCADTYCCTERFQCYDNPSCFQADQTLDDCVDGPDAGSCWSDFTSATPLAKIITNCERVSCVTVCGVP